MLRYLNYAAIKSVYHSNELQLPGTLHTHWFKRTIILKVISYDIPRRDFQLFIDGVGSTVKYNLIHLT